MNELTERLLAIADDARHAITDGVYEDALRDAAGAIRDLESQLADRGPLSLDVALDRAGWVISSRPAFGEMVVIRQKETAAQRQGED